MNGKQYYLVDVIAHVLHHLKCQLLTSLRDFGYKDLKASDIDWVITVPAIWRSKGKKMMREAGYMVSKKFCLLVHVHIVKLVEQSYTLVFIPIQKNL